MRSFGCPAGGHEIALRDLILDCYGKIRERGQSGVNGGPVGLVALALLVLGSGLVVIGRRRSS